MIVVLIVIIGQIMVSDIVKSGKYQNPDVAERVVAGTIYDRTGRALAMEIPSDDLYLKADPESIEMMSQLLAIHVAMTPDSIKQALEGVEAGSWLLFKTGLESTTAQNIQSALDSNGLGELYRLEHEYVRTYPAAFHSAQLIQETENVMDKVLFPNPGYGESTTYGNDVQLTLDLDIQYILDLALQQVYEIHGPDYAVGFILDAKTGEVLADTTYPFYNLNDSSSISDSQKVNRALVSSIGDLDVSVVKAVFKHGTDELVTDYETNGSYTMDLEVIEKLMQSPDGNSSVLAFLPEDDPKYIVFMASVNPKFYLSSYVLDYVLDSIQDGLTAQRKL